MSLLLREKSEQCLEENGLGDYHTRIDESLHLCVVGECGKPLFTVSGIKFARKSPSTGDVNYAIKLLDAFCRTHKEKIRSALIAKAVMGRAIPSDDDCASSVDYIQELTSKLSLVFTKETNLFTFRTNGYAKNIDVNLNGLKKLTSPAKVNAYCKEIEKVTAFDRVNAAFTSAIAALQSCDI